MGHVRIGRGRVRSGPAVFSSGDDKLGRNGVAATGTDAEQLGAARGLTDSTSPSCRKWINIPPRKSELQLQGQRRVKLKRFMRVSKKKLHTRQAGNYR